MASVLVHENNNETAKNDRPRLGRKSPVGSLYKRSRGVSREHGKLYQGCIKLI